MWEQISDLLANSATSDLPPKINGRRMSTWSIWAPKTMSAKLADEGLAAKTSWVSSCYGLDTIPLLTCLVDNHKRSCEGSEEGKLKCPLCMYATHDSSNLGKHKKSKQTPNNSSYISCADQYNVDCHPELTYRCLYPGCTFEPTQDFSEIKKHFSMTRHCTDCTEDGSKEQEIYKTLMIKEARARGVGKRSRWGKFTHLHGYETSF